MSRASGAEMDVLFIRSLYVKQLLHTTGVLRCLVPLRRVERPHQPSQGQVRIPRQGYIWQPMKVTIPLSRVWNPVS